MTALSDAIAAANQSADDAIARVNADETADQQVITDLRTEVARLQAIIDAGGGTPADIQALADLKTKLDQLENPA